MRDTGLVLFDGIPGSGKSTSTHHLRVRLADHRWGAPERRFVRAP